MKAILIDSKTREIREVDYTNFNDIYKFVGCNLFDAVDFNTKNDTVYVDDEGLLTLTHDTMFFTIGDSEQPLAGNGLILGTNDEGESIEPSVTVEEVKEITKFYTLEEVRRLY